MFVEIIASNLSTPSADDKSKINILLATNSLLEYKQIANYSQ